ncbi:MAG: CvpA family protein [Flavobacteriales bacterium]
MNFIDIFVAALLLWFGYKGFKKGLVFELVSIVALSLGIYGGLKFSDRTAEFIMEFVDSQYLPVVAFTITFLVILVLVFAAGKVVEKIVNLAALKLVNKSLGAAFGVLKTLLILSVLIVIVESYDNKLNFVPEDTKNTSMLYNPLLNFANQVLPEIEKNNLYKNLTSSSEEETE